jgi:hypothetical protein
MFVICLDAEEKRKESHCLSVIKLGLFGHPAHILVDITERKENAKKKQTKEGSHKTLIPFFYE